MRGVIVLGFLVACGGGSANVVPDGSPDAIDIDAMPDAVQCPTPDDGDGDGVCDALDVCPTVGDPGQADLDGDLVGWMCDPIERIALPGAGTPAFLHADIHENTFAARTKLACSGPTTCGHTLLQVSADGMLLTSSSSTDPIDAWQAMPAVTWMDGPIVTANNHVFWSRGYSAGDTGVYDLVTRTYTTRATGVFQPDDIHLHSALFRGSDVLAIGLSTSTGQLVDNFVDFLVDGTLLVLDQAQGYGDGSNGVRAISFAGGSRALVPVRRNFQDELKLYTQDAVALQHIVVDGLPLTGMEEIFRLVIEEEDRGFCVRRGNVSFAVSWNAVGNVISHPLPVDSCIAVNATDHGSVRVYRDGDRIVGYSLGAEFHTLTLPSGRVVGSGAPLLIVGVSDVWKIDVDGSSSLVEAGMNTGFASLAGDTIHVLAHHPTDASGNGTFDLTRYRSAQAPQRITILSDVPNGVGGLAVVTTPEGAALVSTGSSTGVMVPSQSMTPVAAGMGIQNTVVRDGRTVVFAENLFGMGALHRYREVNGSPQLEMLDAPGNNMRGHFLDGRTPSGWFTYGNAVTGCRLARFTPTDQLESISCDATVAFLGVRADGVFLVIDESSVYAVDATGAQRIGKATAGRTTAILDTAFSPPVAVGWTGLFDFDNQFSCLAMQPERCWAYPNLPAQTTAHATTNDGIGSFQHIVVDPFAIGSADITIVRSIGPGTVQP